MWRTKSIPANYLFRISILCVSFFFFTALQCEKSRPILPEVSQLGSNTFGMKIDDKIWVPKWNSKNYLFPSREHPELITEYSFKEHLLIITAVNDESKEKIIFAINKLVQSGTYPISVIAVRGNKLNTCSDSTRFFRNYENEKYCNEAYVMAKEDILFSEAIISHLDTLNSIVAGTFKLRLTNNKNQKINFLEGRFDLKFDNYP